MVERFKVFHASTMDELIALLNNSQTIFSTVIFFGKQEDTNIWSAVLDFAYQPVITVDDIAEMDDRRNREMHQFKPTLAA